MNGTIGSGPVMQPSGLLGLLTNESAAIKSKLDVLTGQASSGMVANTYAGLGAQASIALDLRPELQAIGTWQHNVSNAGTRLSLTQSALQQLSDIATNFANQTLNMSLQTSQGINAIATQAQAALQQVRAILNTQTGNNYLFSGQDSANPPLTGSSLAGFVAAVQAPLATLTTGNGVATVTAMLAAANAGSPIAATTVAGRAMIETGPGQDAATGVVAGQNAYAVQTAPSSTGSYVKDLIAGLAGLAAISGGQTATGSDFTTVTTSIGTRLRGAVSALSDEMAGVGQQQAQMTTQTTMLGNLSTVLTTQISAVENVDMATTAAALTQVQNQLQASYQLISRIHGLSLTAFLVPGG